nr:hypothetical protein [Tanacetum cinerariifolium]
MSHRSSAPSPKRSIPSRSHTTTRHKGKEVAKPITPPSKTASEEDSDPEQAQRDKDMQKNLALIAKYFKKIHKPTNNNLRTSSNSKNKNGVPLQAEQYDWLADTDGEVDEQELEAHYSYMAKIQEVPTADSGTNSEPVEQYVETLEKEIDELESEKAEFSDMYDVILQECVSKDVMCSYLMSLSDLDALDELQCLYLHKVKELEKHSISLEIALKNCKEQVKNDTVCNEKASNVFRKEREQYIEIQDLKAKPQDKNIAISELKKLIKQGKAESVDTKFDRPSVVRQLNAQRILKPLVLGKPTPFSDSLERKYFPKTKLVPKTNVLEGLSKPVTAQNLPQTTKKAVSNTNMLKPGMYRIDNMTTHTKAP